MNESESISMDLVQQEPVNWLWYPYIPLGKITLVRGDPGTGKTMFILDLIASLSKGTKFSGEEIDPVISVYQTAEDGYGDTVKPRLVAADADCKRVFYIDESVNLLSFKDERIELAIRETGAKLLVLDPLQAYIGEKVDMNRANEVRPAFRALADVAQKTECAIVIVEHMNKTSDKKSLLRGLGSIDITGSARSILLVHRPDEKNKDIYLAHVKSNLAEKGPSLKFRMEDGKMVFVEESSLTANEILCESGSSFGPEPTKAQQAIDDLQSLLSNGEMPSNEIIEYFKEKGISRRTVENAKQELGIKAVKHGDVWYWTMKEHRSKPLDLGMRC